MNRLLFSFGTWSDETESLVIKTIGILNLNIELGSEREFLSFLGVFLV